MTTTTPETAEGFATDYIVSRANECLRMMSCAALTNHDEFEVAVQGWREEIQRAIDLVPSRVTKSPRREAVITGAWVVGVVVIVAAVVAGAAKVVMAATI